MPIQWGKSSGYYPEGFIFANNTWETISSNQFDFYAVTGEPIAVSTIQSTSGGQYGTLNNPLLWQVLADTANAPAIMVYSNATGEAIGRPLSGGRFALMLLPQPSIYNTAWSNGVYFSQCAGLLGTNCDVTEGFTGNDLGVFSGSFTNTGSAPYFAPWYILTPVNTNISGTFSGNGGGLTNLNVNNLTGFIPITYGTNMLAVVATGCTNATSLVTYLFTATAGSSLVHYDTNHNPIMSVPLDVTVPLHPGESIIGTGITAYAPQIWP